MGTGWGWSSPVAQPDQEELGVVSFLSFLEVQRASFLDLIDFFPSLIEGRTNALVLTVSLSLFAFFLAYGALNLHDLLQHMPPGSTSTSNVELVLPLTKGTKLVGSLTVRFHH